MADTERTVGQKLSDEVYKLVHPEVKKQSIYVSSPTEIENLIEIPLKEDPLDLQHTLVQPFVIDRNYGKQTIIVHLDKPFIQELYILLQSVSHDKEGTISDIAADLGPINDNDDYAKHLRQQHWLLTKPKDLEGFPETKDFANAMKNFYQRDRLPFLATLYNWRFQYQDKLTQIENRYDKIDNQTPILIPAIVWDRDTIRGTRTINRDFYTPPFEIVRRNLLRAHQLPDQAKYNINTTLGNLTVVYLSPSIKENAELWPEKLAIPGRNSNRKQDMGGAQVGVLVNLELQQQAILQSRFINNLEKHALSTI